MYKLGIIGTGCRGIDCFGTLLKRYPEVVIAALCDPNRVRMELAAKRLEIEPAFYSDGNAMFAGENLDAVVITSPDFCHEENALSALKAGVDVLIDKPLATTAKGCRNIIAAAATHRKIAMMGFNLRHHPTLKRLKEIVAAGTLGRILMIENREFYSGGRTYMARCNRRYELCGGLWIHKGSHDFDVFNWLLNFPEPVRVSASAGNRVFVPEGLPFTPPPGVTPGPTCHECPCRELCPDGFTYDRPEWSDAAAACDGYRKDLCLYLSDKNVHDSGIALVEYADGTRASHLECFVTGVNDRLYTVIGDRGQAEVSLERRGIRITPRWRGETATYVLPPPDGNHGGADPLLVEAFVAALKGERSGGDATLEQGLWATAVGQAAEISSREHRMVALAELPQ